MRSRALIRLSRANASVFCRVLTRASTAAFLDSKSAHAKSRGKLA